MTIKAVFFDETRQWREWANWLNVPHEKFEALQREVIARDEHHLRVFEILKPGFDRAKERAARAAAGKPDTYTTADLYPDALPCLRELKRTGYLIGLAGNQPETAEAALRAMNVPADIIASSARWGVEKPSPAFFARIVAEAKCNPAEIAYVGDRLDNDVIPAREAGMKAIFLIRGLWAEDHAKRAAADLAHAKLSALDDLPNVLKKLSA
jgi:HAD superfamily hydrolase (TIGR01549 family)